MSPTIFELHAGSSNKRPPEYIFLENGRTLRDVMNAVKDSPLETLEEAVQAVLGTSSVNTCSVCINCKGWYNNFMSLLYLRVNLCIMLILKLNFMFLGSLTKAEGVKSALLCNICLELRESYSSPFQVPNAINLSKKVLDTIDKTKGPDTADQSTKVLESADQLRKLCYAKERYDLLRLHCIDNPYSFPDVS